MEYAYILLMRRKTYSHDANKTKNVQKPNKYTDYMIEFYTDNSRNDIELYAGEEYNKTVPFYKSYQDTRKVCFTRNDVEQKDVKKLLMF